MNKGLTLGLVFMFVFINITSISGNQIGQTSSSILQRGNILYVDGTCELTDKSNFKEDAEITASTFNHPFLYYEHDVGIENILYPEDGDACKDMKVTVEVKNYGNNNEDGIPVNIVILKEGVNEEYYGTEYIESLEPGDTVFVELPVWTPKDWQSVCKNYINYSINASILLEGDVNPNNDKKEECFTLYFGYYHDIKITAIDSPCEDGPGKTYPVKATITNVGQYSKCCIPIDIRIGKPIVLDNLLDETSWNSVPPTGWYDEHKDFSNDSGWNISYTDNSGGASPEARLRYNQAESDNILYSYDINTLNYSHCRLEFKSYIDHWSGQGLYALEAGYSTDGETWYTLWHEEPEHSEKYDIKRSIMGGNETLYIGFWVTGNPYYFDNWYIDDISVKTFDIISEYSDLACQSDDLEPGESRIFEFDDWTPDFLQYETSGSKDYIVNAVIQVKDDENPSNDIVSKYFVLDYLHDVGIDRITSPNDNTVKGDLCWDNGLPDGRGGLQCSMYLGCSNILIDDFQNEETWLIYGGHFRFVWGRGYSLGNLETVKVYLFEDEGNCNPSMDEYVIIDATDFEEYNTGNYYFGFPEIACDVEFEEVELPPGKWWIGFQPEGGSEVIAYMLTTENKGCGSMVDLQYWGYPRWTNSSYIWGTEFDFSWKLTGYSCRPSVCNYIDPGTKDISAILKNYGTFPELNLFCHAQIWEYISDPGNGTKLYEDNITDIDINIPLGGEVILDFNQFNFANEGRYGLFLSVPVDNDDFQRNNNGRYSICVDDTKPISTYELYPPDPDGENGWYVNDLEVILSAYDPLIMDVSSGVALIKYRVDGGIEQTILGSSGSFLITQADDGDDVLVEYWAIDNVGNIESKNKFFIDMDQTPPTIDLTYEVISGNPWQGWLLEFTATCNDATSGMERVEFILNDELQETVYGSGPTYQWLYRYWGDLSVDIRADAYDIAGNMASDVIEEPCSQENIIPNIYQFQSLSLTNNYTRDIGKSLIFAVFHNYLLHKLVQLGIN